MRKLILAAVSLCGCVACAVEPVAVWNGDFATSVKGDYTLGLNGNSCAPDGLSVTITQNVGVKIDRRASLANTVGMTAVYRCTGLTVGSSVRTLATSSTNPEGNDRSGVNVQANGQTSGIWDNTSTYNTSATQTTVTSSEGEAYVAFVYGPNISGEKGGTTLYLKSGESAWTKAYACAGLKGSSDVVWGLCLGGTRANGAAFPAATGLTITGLALFDQAMTQSEIEAYDFPAVVPPVEPLMLLNFHKDTPVDGWYNHTQADGPTIPKSDMDALTTNAVNFAAGSAGNFFNGNWTRVSSDFASGSYTDVLGGRHTDLAGEIKASLGLPTDFAFGEDVYKTGLMNGGTTGHTATISGLSPEARYVVYAGFGVVKDTTQCQGFKIQATGYASVEAREYVATVTGVGTTAAAAYQSFDENTTIRPGVQGLLVVRLKNVVPDAQGRIAFTLDGERAGINWLAVAKVNARQEPTELTLEPDGDLSLAAVNDALRDSDARAVVTLKDGATVVCDAEPAVTVKLVSVGAVTLSAAAKPAYLDKFDVSGVQGNLYRTWMTRGVGFNFAAGCGPKTDKALEGDTDWYDNAKSENGTDVAFGDGLLKITYASANIYNDSGNKNDYPNNTMVHGYIDDGNGVNITVKGVPYEEYAVIIYATTDDTNNPYLTYKRVNGVDYTYDTDHEDVAKEGTDRWGQGRQSATPAYGVNAIRIVGLKEKTLTVMSPRDTASQSRGCVSAIQIVPYTTFIEPCATLDAVRTRATADYAGNVISGTISGLDRGSWTGAILARVTIGENVFAATVAEDGAFEISVTGLARETVYRPALQVGYEKEGAFTAFLSQPIALYQGEQSYVWTDAWVNELPDAEHFRQTGTWTDGVVLQNGRIVVDATAGATFTPNPDPDYVDRCDSEFTVSLSAAEAVAADADDPLPEGVQAGVRLVKVSATQVKLQFLCSETGWDDGVASGTDPYVYGLDEPVVVKVAFHYQKNPNESADFVKYSVGADFEKSVTTWSSRKKVSEVIVSDGTRLDCLRGNCERDKAVIVDVEILPGEEKSYADEAAAEAAAAKLVVGVSEAVAKVLTTETQKNAYRSYFKVVVRPDTTGSGYHAEVVFAASAAEEIETELAQAVRSVVAGLATETTEAAFNGKPGLYYGLDRGNEPNALTIKDTKVMADADGKVKISIVRPAGAARHFYRVICAPTE